MYRLTPKFPAAIPMKRLAPLLCVLTLLAPVLAHAEASEFQPRGVEPDPEYEIGKKAIERKNWRSAATSFERVVRRDPSDADAQNLLAYANRKLGNMDLAFKHYAKALALNPAHRGAHEYVGEAYLMVRNPAKAREHLAALDKLCPADCEERQLLRKAIAAYEKNGAVSANY